MGNRPTAAPPEPTHTRHKTQEQKQARHLTTSHTTIDSECFGCAFGAEDYDHCNDGPTPRFAQNTAARPPRPLFALLSLARQLMTREQQQQGSRARLFLPFASFPFPLGPTQFSPSTTPAPAGSPPRAFRIAANRAGESPKRFGRVSIAPPSVLGARACSRLWAGMVGCSMLGLRRRQEGARGGRWARKELPNPVSTRLAAQGRGPGSCCWGIWDGGKQIRAGGVPSHIIQAAAWLLRMLGLLPPPPMHAPRGTRRPAAGRPVTLRWEGPCACRCSIYAGPRCCVGWRGGGKQQHGRGRDGRSPRFKEAAQGGGGKGPRKPPSGGALRGTERPRHSAVRGAGGWLWMGAGWGWRVGVLARSTLGAGCWLGPPTNTNTYPPTHTHTCTHETHTGQGW